MPSEPDAGTSDTDESGDESERERTGGEPGWFQRRWGKRLLPDWNRELIGTISSVLRMSVLLVGCTAIAVAVVTAFGASIGSVPRLSRQLTAVLTRQFHSLLLVALVVVAALIYGLYRTHRFGRYGSGLDGGRSATGLSAQAQNGEADGDEDEPEQSVTVAGSDLAATLSRAVTAAEPGLANEPVDDARAALRERVETTYAATQGCSREAAASVVATGSWPANRTARAFLSDADEPVPHPLWRRLLGWFAPRLACRIRIQQTMAALRELDAASRPSGSSKQPAGTTISDHDPETAPEPGQSDAAGRVTG
jgi:hypothetical protein